VASAESKSEVLRTAEARKKAVAKFFNLHGNRVMEKNTTLRTKGRPQGCACGEGEEEKTSVGHGLRGYRTQTERPGRPGHTKRNLSQTPWGPGQP